MTSPVWINTYAPAAASFGAASNENGWILDQGANNLYYFDSTNSLWLQQATPPFITPVTISAAQQADSEGPLIALGQDGILYQLDFIGGFWNQLPLEVDNIINATIGDSTHYVVVDEQLNVVASANGSLSPLPSGPVKVTATPNLDYIWGLDSLGTVLCYNSINDEWDTVPGKKFSQIHASLNSISTNAPQVVGVDHRGAGWRYDFSNYVWTSILPPDVGDKFASIEGGEGCLWAVLTSQQVFLGLI